MATQPLNIEVSIEESTKASMVINQSDLENRFVCLVRRISQNHWAIAVDFSDDSESQRARIWNTMEFNLTIGGVQQFKIS